MTHCLICLERMKFLGAQCECWRSSPRCCRCCSNSGTRAESSDSSKPSKKVAQTILQLEAQWDRAVVAHDRTELDKLMGRDFVATDVYGNIHSRADYLNALTSRDVQYEYRHSDEIHVQTWGDTADRAGARGGEGPFPRA